MKLFSIALAKVVALALVLVVLGQACGHFKGDKGDSGSVGPTGGVGPKGDSGEPGTDSNPITVVKLCPGTPTYPSVFVEYAFCIEGKLYGTYSANGGFTAYLPDGQYHSEGIGSRCDFTIEGCIINP